VSASRIVPIIAASAQEAASSAVAGSSPRPRVEPGRAAGDGEGEDMEPPERVRAGHAGAGAELIGPLRRLGPELDTFAMIPAPALGQLNMDPPQPVPSQGDGAFPAGFPPPRSTP